MGAFPCRYGGAHCRECLMIAGRAAGVYCFTIDDNIRFLEECTKSNLGSVFDHPYPAMLRRMYFAYGTKFQLNMYYCYALNEFSLADVPDIWRNELEQNSGWLRFSFHAYANDPPFPYDNAAADNVLADYRAVMVQMHRIAGKAATDATTTLHYVCATKETCTALRKEGVRGLIGMFLPINDRRALRYYLTSQQASILQQYRLWHDSETDISFLCNNIVLNAVSLDEITPLLSRQISNIYHVMIYEQYFYPDYIDYQPDFEKKIDAAISFFQTLGLNSCFFEELV